MVERANRSGGKGRTSRLRQSSVLLFQHGFVTGRASAGGGVGWGADPTPLALASQHGVAAIHWQGGGGAASCPFISAQQCVAPAGAARAVTKGPSASRTRTTEAAFVQALELRMPA
jgi:hypothetical protein